MSLDAPTREVSKKILSRLRWHAELGAGSFDTLRPEAAAENAQWRLEIICRILDEIEDNERSERIFALFADAPGLSRRVAS